MQDSRWLEFRLVLQAKNILIVSPEHWTHIFLSKHHYAITLAGLGNQVFFVNPPSDAFRITPSDYRGLQIVDYKGFLPGLQYLPKWLRKMIQRRVFNQIEKRIDKKINLVWSFDNSVFYDLDFLPKRVMSISHMVDQNQDFQFERAARSSNLFLCVTQHILKKAQVFNPQSYFINHGYDTSVRPEPIELELSGKLRVGYAGSLDMKYIDWDIVEQVVRKHQELNFYFAGHTKEFRLKHLDNAIYIGKLSKSALFDFYRQMDLLILAYKADEYQEQLANSHKMMEYLGTGKPIVATSTLHYRPYSDIIAMSDKNREWPALFTKTVQDFPVWNDVSKSEARKQVALENTYLKQIDRISKLIEQL